MPTADGATFWGYTSVPTEGCLWWSSLPVYIDDARELEVCRRERDYYHKRFLVELNIAYEARFGRKAR